MKTSLFALATCLASQAFASNVAIVDSGTWTGHDWFKGQAWQNPAEIVGNLVDDDRNGLVDDVGGWNFAENLSKFFFIEHTANVDQKVYKIFEIISKIELQTISAEEKEWWNANVAGLPEAQKNDLIALVNWFGQYAHGTHTGGIVAHGNPAAKIMSARTFPDTLPPEATAFYVPRIPESAEKSFVHNLLASQANKVFIDVAKYLQAQKMDVANYSLGVPLAAVAKQFLSTLGQRDPSPEKIKAEAWKFYEAFEKIGAKWMASAPDTLFVVAAGNDGASNEELPIFPANIHAPNTITVAATHGYDSLAPFSNYGPSVVQVAAPGVAVRSSVPGLEASATLPMSGTSMAAPFVSMVASRIKDTNPALTAQDIRRILMETVDYKEWLVGKVETGGVVNMNRALATAELTRSVSLDQALGQTRTAVADMQSVPEDKGSSVTPTAEMRAWAEALRF